MDKISSLAEKLHENGSLLIVSANPTSLSVLKPPAEYGTDIFTGEGQPLGGNLSYGGAALGLMATKEKYVRQLPSRIAGQTVDKNGKTGYVLTLQTREQHIKRERATSNICSNQALNALGALVYMMTYGEKGLRLSAENSMNKAHYLADKFSKIGGVSVMNASFFNEFTIELNISPSTLNDKLLKQGIIGGLDISKESDTEKNLYLIGIGDKISKQDMDRFIEITAKAVK